MKQNKPLEYSKLNDLQLAHLIAKRDQNAAEFLIRQNNQRLFRVALSILKTKFDAEDALQIAYLQAFSKIETYNGEASLNTWLTKIVINTALSRLRNVVRHSKAINERKIILLSEQKEALISQNADQNNIEAILYREQLRNALEKVIAKLPSNYRIVFVLREIEDMSIELTANLLQIPQSTVKSRHLRAKKLLREFLDPEIQAALKGTFPFAGNDCDILTNRTIEKFLNS